MCVSFFLLYCLLGDSCNMYTQPVLLTCDSNGRHRDVVGIAETGSGKRFFQKNVSCTLLQIEICIHRFEAVLSANPLITIIYSYYDNPMNKTQPQVKH